MINSQYRGRRSAAEHRPDLTFLELARPMMARSADPEAAILDPW